MKNNWQTKILEDCIEKVVYTKKIQRKSFLKSGVVPIISQEETFINGYWNNKKDIFRVKTPVVIFGDHTQILKYIDFNFVLGADGVKILQPKSFLNPKFFLYFLRSVDLKKLGYARHYRLLKEISVSYPESLAEQERIVKTLDGVFDKISRTKEIAKQKLVALNDLEKSILKEVIKQPL